MMKMTLRRREVLETLLYGHAIPISGSIRAWLGSQGIKLVQLTRSDGVIEYVCANLDAARELLDSEDPF